MNRQPGQMAGRAYYRPKFSLRAELEQVTGLRADAARPQPPVSRPAEAGAQTCANDHPTGRGYLIGRPPETPNHSSVVVIACSCCDEQTSLGLDHERTRQVADLPSQASEPADSEFPDHGVSTAGQSGYLPVSEHGLIGDLHCVALVGTNGTIDWHCCPSFDAPSMFGSLLDADRGGCFELAAAVPAKPASSTSPTPTC